MLRLKLHKMHAMTTYKEQEKEKAFKNRKISMETQIDKPKYDQPKPQIKTKKISHYSTQIK